MAGRSWLLNAAMEHRAREDRARKNADFRGEGAGLNRHAASALPAARCLGCDKRLIRGCKFELCRTCRGPVVS